MDNRDRKHTDRVTVIAVEASSSHWSDPPDKVRVFVDGAPYLECDSWASFFDADRVFGFSDAHIVRVVPGLSSAGEINTMRDKGVAAEIDLTIAIAALIRDYIDKALPRHTIGQQDIWHLAADCVEAVEALVDRRARLAARSTSRSQEQA